MPVTLSQILLAREARVLRQQLLLKAHRCTLVSFTLNIPGPEKNSPLIRRAFRFGCRQLEQRLPGILYREESDAPTGCEAMYCLDMPPRAVKEICTAIEDETPLGRLFDMDVLTAEGEPLSRQLVGGKSRDCIVCGAPGRGCASRRLHSANETYAAAVKIMEQHFLLQDRERIAAIAVQSLLQEVDVTPKPGLVDRRNTGSHRDMDRHTFALSARALEPYFRECVRIGQETAGQSPEETFALLRQAGRAAEDAMFRATKGVNTHKGAIFILGLLCGSLGRLWQPDAPVAETREILEEAGLLGTICLTRDLSGITPLPETVGSRLYRELGISGVRGEAAGGFPSVGALALPVYRACLAEGRRENDAGVITLLHLIAEVEDTTLYSRGGTQGAAWAKAAAAALLPRPETEAVCRLDDAFIQRNLSAGGCADLLAATIFLHALEKVFQAE